MDELFSLNTQFCNTISLERHSMAPPYREEFKLKVRRQRDVIGGDKFRRFLQRIIAKKNYIQILERKDYPFFLIEILLDNGSDDLDIDARLIGVMIGFTRS